MVIRPGALTVPGDRSWYLPRWLGWLPRIEVDPAPVPAPVLSDAALLLEGIVLRLQADLHWLEACERTWITRRHSR